VFAQKPFLINRIASGGGISSVRPTSGRGLGRVGRLGPAQDDLGGRLVAVGVLTGDFLPAGAHLQPEDGGGHRLAMVARGLAEQALGDLGVRQDVPVSSSAR